MPNTLDENDGHDENKTNEDNISCASMHRYMKKVRHFASETKEKNCHFEETY
jgi:hypothetical protein